MSEHVRIDGDTLHLPGGVTVSFQAAFSAGLSSDPQNCPDRSVTRLGGDQSPWVARTPEQTVGLEDPVAGTPVTDGAW